MDNMETYIRYDQSTGIITFVHHQPFDPVHGLGQTRDELSKTGVFVNDFPTAERKEGKRSIAYYNPELKKVYYEYELLPLTDSERVDMLEDAVNMIIMANMGGDD